MRYPAHRCRTQQQEGKKGSRLWILLGAAGGVGGGALGVLVLTLFGSGCATVPDYITGEPTYNLFAMEQDVSLGQRVLEQNLEAFRENGVPIDQDEARLNQIRGTVNRLRQVVELPDLPWEAHLIQTNLVNAAAAPGGKIMVFEGLFDPQKGMVRNENELAAVMAHEMAHVTARHVTESLTRQTGMETAGQLISAALSEASGAQAAEAFSYLYSGASMFILPHYSRQQEAEADRVGLFYMAEAGYDPAAALEIWRRAAQAEGEEQSALFGFLSSHPGNLSRLDQLREHYPRAREIYLQATGQAPGPDPVIGGQPPVEGGVRNLRGQPADPGRGTPPVVRARPLQPGSTP